jgi:hypothetical protein
VAKKKICPFQDKVVVSTLVILFYEKVWNKKKKDKRTNNDLQSTTHKAKYRIDRHDSRIINILYVCSLSH